LCAIRGKTESALDGSLTISSFFALRTNVGISFICRQRFLARQHAKSFPKTESRSDFAQITLSIVCDETIMIS
jgi:hypothetical protein